MLLVLKAFVNAMRPVMAPVFLTKCPAALFPVRFQSKAVGYSSMMRSVRGTGGWHWGARANRFRACWARGGNNPPVSGEDLLTF